MHSRDNQAFDGLEKYYRFHQIFQGIYKLDGLRCTPRPRQTFEWPQQATLTRKVVSPSHFQDINLSRSKTKEVPMV